MKGETVNVADVAASFQEAIVDVLVRKTLLALEKTKAPTLVLAGGGAANTLLRERLTEVTQNRGISFNYPPPILCTDNGAMIATAGYYRYLAKDYAPWNLNAVPGLNLV